jgi:hypothetical protein
LFFFIFIHSSCSGLYVDVSYIGTSATVQINTYSGADRQLWLVSASSGYAKKKKKKKSASKSLNYFILINLFFIFQIIHNFQQGDRNILDGKLLVHLSTHHLFLFQRSPTLEFYPSVNNLLYLRVKVSI